MPDNDTKNCMECGHTRDGHDYPGTKANPAVCLNENCECYEFEEFTVLVDPILESIPRWKQGPDPRPASDGGWVRFSDLPALVTRVREDEELTQIDHLKSHRDEWIADGYAEGQLDGRKLTVLTADSPEPPIGSVVLVRGFWSFCRGADGYWYWGDVRWAWDHWWATFGHDNPTLIYEGEDNG